MTKPVQVYEGDGVDHDNPPWTISPVTSRALRSMVSTCSNENIRATLTMLSFNMDRGTVLGYRSARKLMEDEYKRLSGIEGSRPIEGSHFMRVLHWLRSLP